MRRPLYGWLSAEAVSLTGTRVSMIALPWFVLTTTGSATRTGLVALVELLPLVVLKVLGGPVIDRLGPRRVAITCDVGSVAVVGAIPLLHGLGALSFGLFLALVALAGALRGPSDAAKGAMVPALAREAAVPLERATGLHSTVKRTATLLGSICAGLLVAAVGPATALLVDALSFGLAAALLAWATRPPVENPAESAHMCADSAAPSTGGYARQLREGWDFLRRDPVLLGISVMVALTNLLDVAYVSVLLPVWADEYGGGAAAIGLVLAVFGGASAVGALCAAAWAAGLPRYATYLVAFLVAGAPRFVVLALDTPTWAVLAVSVASGFAAGFLNPVLGAVIFERIPEPLVGRVSSLTTAMCFALMPLGGLLAGVLVGGIGLAPALVAVGVAYLAVTMLPALDPRWRELDSRQPGPDGRDGGLHAVAAAGPVEDGGPRAVAGARSPSRPIR
ncbi:MFS transporter [Nocardioides lianchengensis]|uniref:Multidrug efflux pump Tap n=1 Tax=Nocardioides lianchengensis TaxID=1045774 RepID=A0A1G6L070_9ACTN|nr:MFS transporter [Nocardioides lianchengensis]NYG13748.1 MFS family permease [Nocardioides lianchengensis]SDC36115.1 Predicted arabinose efflux permease, MFS family [Nocardioides lianchengensis]